MCGVFSYFGKRTNVEELIMKGLKSLEYRGYDSWGIAYKTSDGIEIKKEVGKISDFLNTPKYTETGLENNIAIGHSRWATHGGVTQKNAHPHTSADQSIVLVHNGIIENFFELKNELIANGVNFVSETDTEVFAHLISLYKHNGLEKAVEMALRKAKGRYAIVVISKNENKLIAARVGSPLIIGINKKDNEYFIASDIPAFLEYTNTVMYLDDGQMVTIDSNGAHFFEMATGNRVEKRLITIDWNIENAQKGEFEHFMIKEIMEQKETISRAINQDMNMILNLAKEIKSSYGTFLVGCGTAGKVCMIAEYLFAHISKRHINVCFGSEFDHYKNFITERSLMIAVSQSGETADTLEAMEVAKRKNAKTASIVNVETSTMARISDFLIPVKAGPEKAVASTKVTTSQIAILTLLAYALADNLEEGERLLIATASQINDMLNPRFETHIDSVAKIIGSTESMYIIGKDMNYPVALEAAIKLQEVSYIHAEGFAGGELKHGPIALITKGTPVIVIVANDAYKSDILSNAMEIKARGGYIIGISPENSEIFDQWIKVPDAGNASPIVNIIPIQLLAYKLALIKQNNPDMPRNLAKSVTVK